jgi:MFS superfamily sulfate permease-like transporter
MPAIFFEYVILFAIIGSLESLLTAKAVDLLDPYPRKSNFNKDLMAVGAGNVLAGLFGGLPMISEVARSSANVQNGGKTRWANVFHGLFLLLFALFLVPEIEMIPNAALAAMLIGVGIKLTHPREFAHMLHTGWDQLLIFVATIVITLGVDLLAGIGAGIVLKILLHLFRGAPAGSLFRAEVQVEQTGDSTWRLMVRRAAVFTNYLGLKKRLDALPDGQTVIVDMSGTRLVDHTVLENLSHFQHEYRERGGHFEITGMDHLEPISHHPLSSRAAARPETSAVLMNS